MEIPEFTTKEELFVYLKANKERLVADKKLSTKYTDSISSTPIIARREGKEQSTKDSTTPSPEPDPAKSTLDVTVVCNTAWWVDSQLDVLTDKAYTKSVAARGNTIPHIADHMQTSTSHVGDVNKVYTKVISLKDLGLDQPGDTTALLMDTTIRKDYNEDVFKFYNNGKINQHSIGLRYVDIQMAINNNTEDYQAEKAVWDEYYPSIINKDVVDQKGYFWIVPEVDVMENSCVLFGANSLTPTLSVKSDILTEGKHVDITTIPEVMDFQQPTTKGANTMAMTLEEAVMKLMEKDAELQAIKASTSLEVAKAVKAEVSRIKGIFEAAKTFNVSNESAIKFVDLGASVDTVVASFETVKAERQAATHVDTTSATVTSTVKEISTLSLSDQLVKTMEGYQPEADPIRSML